MNRKSTSFSLGTSVPVGISSPFPRGAMLSACFALLFATAGSAFGQSSALDLDAIAKHAIAREHVAGASVLIVRANQVIFHKSYGFADLGLEAPAKDETVYRLVGPMMPFTGVAVMQQVERGKLSLDDDISKFIPEFPLQGRHVSVRELLNHTSGIVDYHYLGDAIEGAEREPKALDEIMALYSGRPWVNEPGTKWDWTISGFQLLVTIVERVSGQSYDEYVQQNILAPAGVKSFTYCDDFALVHGLAHGYRRRADSFVLTHESDMSFNKDIRFCSNAEDLYKAWRAVREKHLVKPETLKLMSTAEGPAAHMSAQDPKAQYGLALYLNHEDDHRSIGQHGSLLGFASSFYEFPDDQLTVIVLTNTEGQNAHAIARPLTRAVLGLPALPEQAEAPAERTLVDKAVSAKERAQFAGTFLLKFDKLPANLHGSFLQYRRTYRVFDENGRLMIEMLGLGPEQLLKQEDGSFAMRSAPQNRISFTMQGDRATGIKIDPIGPGGLAVAGERVGDSNPQTFHRALN